MTQDVCVPDHREPIASASTAPATAQRPSPTSPSLGVLPEIPPSARTGSPPRPVRHPRDHANPATTATPLAPVVTARLPAPAALPRAPLRAGRTGSTPGRGSQRADASSLRSAGSEGPRPSTPAAAAPPTCTSVALVAACQERAERCAAAPRCEQIGRDPPALRQPRRSPPHPCAGTHHPPPPAARSTAGSRPLAPARRDTSPDVFAAAAPARTAAPSAPAARAPRSTSRPATASSAHTPLAHPAAATDDSPQPPGDPATAGSHSTGTRCRSPTR